MRFVASTGVAVIAVLVASSAVAQKKYGPGVSDSEIKLGNTNPYSGPASVFGSNGLTLTAYINRVNGAGGVNGRKINLISLDDAYSPPKTVEQTRKLVESDEVLAIVSSVGTPTNLAVAKYLNAKKVPQILLNAVTPKLVDPVNLPWTSTFYANQDVEGRLYAQYVLATNANAKIAILFQNDDYGRGYVTAFETGLGSRASTMIVKKIGYEIGDATIESSIVSLKASQADVFLDFSTPKFVAQALRKASELGWKPLHIILAAANQPSALSAAGHEASVGLVTSRWMKPIDDPDFQSDRGVQDYLAFMKERGGGRDPSDSANQISYSNAMMLVEILRRCGDDLTRENVLKQATNVSNFQLPLFLDGVKVNIAPSDRVAWRQARLTRYDGTRWRFFGDIVSVPANPNP